METLKPLSGQEIILTKTIAIEVIRQNGQPPEIIPWEEIKEKLGPRFTLENLTDDFFWRDQQKELQRLGITAINFKY